MRIQLSGGAQAGGVQLEVVTVEPIRKGAELLLEYSDAMPGGDGGNHCIAVIQKPDARHPRSVGGCWECWPMHCWRFTQVSYLQRGGGGSSSGHPPWEPSRDEKAVARLASWPTPGVEVRECEEEGSRLRRLRHA